MAGQRDTGAEPDAKPRPLTYEAASARYMGPEAGYERFTELRWFRSCDVTALARVV